MIIEYKVEESYPIEVNNYLLTAKAYGNKAPMVAKLTWILVSKLAIIRMINPLLEMKLDNRITIYRNKKNINSIKEVVENHL